MSYEKVIRNERRGLKPELHLRIDEKGTGNFFGIRILGELGRGAGCIVYSGKHIMIALNVVVIKRMDVFSFTVSINEVDGRFFC